MNLSVTVPGLGGSRAAGATPAPDAASKVKLVVLTHAGPDGGGTQSFTTITNPIAQSYGALPVGVYVFVAKAYDGTDAGAATVLFSGQVQVEVHGNQMTTVHLVLQQVVPPGTIADRAPYIDSIVVSNGSPAGGETITLTADVTGSGDLSFRWTAACSGPLVKNGEVLDPSQGEVFSDATSKSTRFTSYCTGDETITFSATQSSETGGRSAATSFTLEYAAQGGNVIVSFNSFPDILAIATGGNAQPPYGAKLTLAATVQDADGEAVTAAWKDNCGGRFDDPASLTPVWTAPAAPGGTKPSTSPLACKLALFVSDGKGGTNTGWLTVRVGSAAVKTLVKRYPFPRFAYVLNYGDKTVTAYTVDARTGALTSVGSVATGTSPYSFALDPSGKHLYVVNNGDGNISAFGIDPSTGALNAASTLTAPVAVIAFAPSGERAYVVNMDATVSTYGVDAGSGALTTIAATTTLEERPSELVVHPSGRFAFGSLSPYNTVRAYSIDASGALSVVNTANTGSTPQSLTVHPSGRFAYVANLNSHTVGAYAIDAATGALTQIGSDVATGKSPYSLAIDPSGKYAFVGNQGDSTVSVYSINDASGALTSTGAAVPAGVAPRVVASDPSGKFLYVVSTRGVAVFAIGADGALTSSGTPVTVPTGSQRAIVMTGVYPPPFAYVGNVLDSTISTYTIDTVTGALATAGPAAPTAPCPWLMAADPLGRFLFTLNYGNTPGDSEGGPNSVISAHAIDPVTGALTLVGSVPEPYVNSLVVDPAGKYLYSSNNSQRRRSDPPAKVATYVIDQATGALTRASVVDTYIAPWSIGVDPSGKFVYEVSYKSIVSAYSSDPSTGALTSIGQVPTPDTVGCGGSHYRIAIDPFGRFLYEVNCTGFLGTSQGSIASYAIDPSTGALTLMGHWGSWTSGYAGVTADPSGRFVFLLGDTGISTYAVDAFGILTLQSEVALRTSTMALDPTGQFLYVMNPYPTNSVSTYAVDPFTGALTAVGSPAPTGQIPGPIVTVPGKGPWVVADLIGPTPPPPAPTHSLGGTVSGLSGTLALVNNGSHDLTVTADGTFTFALAVTEGSAYAVTVKTQPSGQTCTVANGSGTMGTANVTDVAVTCAASSGSRLGDVCDVNANTCTGDFPSCWNFNTFTPPGRCTKTCSLDADCPLGSNGVRHCNNAGYCRP